MSRRLDLLGQKFGKLTVIEFSHRNNRHLYWSALCECGKKTIQCTTNLRQGKVISCGCQRNQKSGERLKELPRVKYELGVASFNVLYNQYEHGAKRRNFNWNLDKEQFKILTSGNCWYCDTPPKTEISRRGVNGNYVYNGIDRLSSKIGYEIDNCVSCCKICNVMKMDTEYKEFLNKIDSIYKFRLSKNE